MSKSLYTEVVTLPSKGLLNPEISEGEVTIRCITIADQKYLSGTNQSGEKMVQGLLKRCVISPETFNPAKLTSVDSFFLILKLRILSYGGNYTFRTKCPDCGKKIDVNTNLSDLEVDYLDEDYEDAMNVKLPRAGGVVYTKLLTGEDEESINKEIKRLHKKFESEEDPGVVLRLARSITKIELEEPNNAGDDVLTDVIDIQKYVEGLTDLDSIAISSTLTPDYGVNTLIETVCRECREEIELKMGVNSQFFRPKYDSTNR